MCIRDSLCLAVCPEHGPVKAKIRIKKAEDGSLYVVKTAKITDEEGVDLSLIHIWRPVWCLDFSSAPSAAW